MTYYSGSHLVPVWAFCQYRVADAVLSRLDQSTLEWNTVQSNTVQSYRVQKGTPFIVIITTLQRHCISLVTVVPYTHLLLSHHMFFSSFPTSLSGLLHVLMLTGEHYPIVLSLLR